LLGSIREDIKVRYWFAPEFLGEYHSFHADVILPQGNYAARVIMDGQHLLVYNFFYASGKIDSLRVLPPPKQLDTDSSGRLILRSYYRWQQMTGSVIEQTDFGSIENLFSNSTATMTIENRKWILGARSGYEIFCFERPSQSFIWEGLLTLEGMGKFGLVSDMDKDGNGYFVSFNVSSGVVQIRAWGFNSLNARHNFIFNELQSNTFTVNEQHSILFRFIRYGHYIELSIDNQVKLTLMDYTYSGKFLGFYSASSIISLQDSVFKILSDPEDEYASQEEAQKI
jgi:beta-fructofuranosidase